MKAKWTNIPFPPARSPFFYGWIIVATSTIGTIASIPGQTMGVSVFTSDLMEALNLSSIQLSTAYMFGTIGSSLLLPLAGGLADRIGLRAMMVLSAAFLGVSMVGIAFSATIAGQATEQSYALPFAVIMICILCIRFSGQGCLTMASRVAIGKWFNHRRGLATGISSVLVSFGFNGSPRLLNHMVESWGWQTTCLALAAIVGIGMSLIGWIFHRDNPEQCGLVMDGITDESWQKAMAEKVPETRREFTKNEAMKTFTFWAFNLALGSQALIITAAVFHIASMGSEAGLTRTESFAVFLPMSFFSVATGFASGWASDRIKLKWLLIAMMIAQAFGTLGITTFGSTYGQWLFTIGFGAAGGLFGTIATVAWPRFFGREHLGAINGINMSVMVFASAIGPVLFSKGHEITGSFRQISLFCLIMPITIILMGFRAENPQETI